MTEQTAKKQGIKKCRSATFSIDGFSFTIVASEAGGSNHYPLGRFRRSRSQNALATEVTASVGIWEQKGELMDPRNLAEILADELPSPSAPDAIEKTAIRLRCLIKQLERGEASVVDLKKNLEFAAIVLESLYTEEARGLGDSGDELRDIHSDSVPSEVRDWLASTFTCQRSLKLCCSEDKPRFRSIVHAVQAGIFVERMYRRSSNQSGLIYPPNVMALLKHVDLWSFDVFELNDISGDHALKFVLYELLTRYDLLNHFKVPVSTLMSFVESLEVGYSKHKNPYHNLMHAADVTQTIHYMLLKTGMAHWLTELEIFALIFSAAIHDYEHTGTTNNFHVQTRSETALLYNDRSVLENHHVSAVYRLLQVDEMNILYNLSKDDWRELRTMVVEMVLATDMSCHFQQIKAMKTLLQQPEEIDKPKALSLILHTADISHPAKRWDLHHRWTTSLLEEFFKQLYIHSINGSDEKHSGVKTSSSEGSFSLTAVDFKSLKVTWNQEINHNRERWKAQEGKGTMRSQPRRQGWQPRTEGFENGQKSKLTDNKGNNGLQNVTSEMAEQKKEKEVRKEQPKEEEGDKGAGVVGCAVQNSNSNKSLRHTEEQQLQNDSEGPVIQHCKKPSYCASSYRLVRTKVTEMRLTDARAKARRLQRISLRRRK
ncbi:calcium/calmodulin-dependent 3',5'-cyclic nucleotide phosphodiesterase 1C-like [Thalassophryne amazonica]|uniref:calcium/calmodulin-dependent 3',5'-cyclic nucleotide phosphodiesterase 1C-like n=1 Tax=Thalassophryne amazonica TaxID=390379 RepID=UPI001470BF62|nr:calcium/calmodulin-dependent 3',5'-cyclic nucleotide phosphodiesterase 1C-like [Thalassophryne amazonica]